MWTVAFWKDLAERLLWTFVETFVGVLLTVQIADVDMATAKAALAAALAAVLSALKSVAAGQLKKSGGKGTDEQTASLGAKSYTYV